MQEEAFDEGIEEGKEFSAEDAVARREAMLTGEDRPTIADQELSASNLSLRDGNIVDENGSILATVVPAEGGKGILFQPSEGSQLGLSTAIYLDMRAVDMNLMKARFPEGYKDIERQLSEKDHGYIG